jgi:hypothetical protein
MSLIYTAAMGLPLASALWSALGEHPRVRLVQSVLDAVENIEEMDQPTFHLRRANEVGNWSRRILKSLG